MNVNSIGDLAKNLQLRRDTGRIKTDLTRLTNELSSGIDSNLVRRFKGNFGPLAGVERGILRSESFLSVISERQLIVSGQQTALTNLRALGEVSGALLTVQDTGDATLVASAGYDALSRFSSALANLNTQSGGQSIFAGIDTDRPAVADSETILMDIEAEIALAGAVTAADVATVVETWFAPGGGYDTIGYTGGAASQGRLQLSEGEVATPLPTAEDDAIRDYLSGLAMGSLLARNVLPSDPVEQGTLARLAGLRLFEADASIVDLQARIGAAEGQVNRARVEVMAESESLQIARSELIGVDPYETAVELQSAETQLQTLYSVTARLSRLSLTGYL